jgi:hypothetical protein
MGRARDCPADNGLSRIGLRAMVTIRLFDERKQEPGAE